jgi:hypothetical protein
LYDAWCIMKASWERKTGKKVKRFCTDGGGELGGGEFVKSLEKDGIQWDVVPRYEQRMGRWNKSFAPSKDGCLPCSQRLNCLSTTGARQP